MKYRQLFQCYGRIITGVFFVVLVLNSNPTFSQDAVVSSVEPAELNTQNGDTVTIALNIDMSGSSPPNDLLGNFTASLQWDFNVLKYVSNSGILQGYTGAINSNNVSAGRLLFNAVSTSGRSGNFNLMQVTFEVVGSLGTVSMLDLEYSALAAAGTFADLLPILTVNDGQINVNTPPLNFGLLEPADGEEINTLNPFLVWQEAVDADQGDSVHYEIILSTSTDFADTLIFAETADTTSQVGPGLAPSQQYYWKISAVDLAGFRTESDAPFSFSTSDDATDISDPHSDLNPTKFDLYQNYPNPFNPETRIQYELPKASYVRIEIFNLLGQRIRTLVDEAKPAGVHTSVWDGRGKNGEPAASGPYIYRLKTRDAEISRKLLLLR